MELDLTASNNDQLVPATVAEEDVVPETHPIRTQLIVQVRPRCVMESLNG